MSFRAEVLCGSLPGGEEGQKKSVGGYSRLIFTCFEFFWGPGLHVAYFKAQLSGLVIIAIKFAYA